MVSKIQAAQRQLDAAIKIYFEGGDYLAAYALAAASLEVTENLYSKNREDIIKRQLHEGNGDYKKIQFSYMETLKMAVKEEHWNEAYKLFRRTQNFLKHADKDADQEIEDVDGELLLVYLSLASRNFSLVTGKTTFAMHIAIVFCFLIKDNFFKKDEASSMLINAVESLRNQLNTIGLEKTKVAMLAVIIQQNKKLKLTLPSLRQALEIIEFAGDSLIPANSKLFIE
jgi:hypothetical protein